MHAISGRSVKTGRIPDQRSRLNLTMQRSAETPPYLPISFVTFRNVTILHVLIQYICEPAQVLAECAVLR